MGKNFKVNIFKQQRKKCYGPKKDFDETLCYFLENDTGIILKEGKKNTVKQRPNGVTC